MVMIMNLIMHVRARDSKLIVLVFDEIEFIISILHWAWRLRWCLL